MRFSIVFTLLVVTNSFSIHTKDLVGWCSGNDQNLNAWCNMYIYGVLDEMSEDKTSPICLGDIYTLSKKSDKLIEQLVNDYKQNPNVYKKEKKASVHINKIARELFTCGDK